MTTATTVHTVNASKSKTTAIGAAMTKRNNKAAKAKESALTDIDWRATFIEALNAPGALGNTYNRFYNYSFLNQIRLMMQGVAEPVATYKVWLGLGRQVRKGSKAKMVLAPVIITKRDENGAPATVCMPWRAQPDRLSAHDDCVGFWTGNGFLVIEADSDPTEWFSVSQARNNAVRQANTPVVIIVDANKFPGDIAVVQQAIEFAAKGGVAFLCSGGGFIVASRESFWSIGGFDENFKLGVWGLEDSAFIHAADTLLDTVRLDGAVCVFGPGHHQSGWKSRTGCGPPGKDNPNWSQYVPYETARGDPKAMRELLRVINA